MDLNTFKDLSLAERTCAVFAYGTLLASRPQESYTMVLYHIDKFFVEAHFDQMQKRIISAQSYKDGSCFSSYLPYIHLSEL